jgi:hypothetical protein
MLGVQGATKQNQEEGGNSTRKCPSESRKSTRDAMQALTWTLRHHHQPVRRSPCTSEWSLLVHADGCAKDHHQALLGGLLILAFYHFSQGATIIAVLIIVCANWIIGRMKDRLLIRRWHQMPRTCDVRHQQHTSIYIHILLQHNGQMSQFHSRHE